MRLTLGTLYQDHDNLRRILCLLERLLIDIYRGSAAGYPLIVPILKYIRDFPASIHHPAEYAVFSAMPSSCDSDIRFHEDVSSLMQDHTEIEDMLRNSIDALEPALASSGPDIAYIGDKLSTIIDRERAHLLYEETNLYPYIAEHLDSGKWAIISALIPDYEDPLFGAKVRKDYEQIFNAL